MTIIFFYNFKPFRLKQCLNFGFCDCNILNGGSGFLWRITSLGTSFQAATRMLCLLTLLPIVAPCYIRWEKTSQITPSDLTPGRIKVSKMRASKLSVRISKSPSFHFEPL